MYIIYKKDVLWMYRCNFNLIKRLFIKFKKIIRYLLVFYGFENLY